MSLPCVCEHKSGETGLMHRLALAFADPICDWDKNQSQELSYTEMHVGTNIPHLLTVELVFNSAYWEILHDFLLSAYFFFKINFWKNSFRNTIRVSNSLDRDQARHFVGPDLGPNSLQKLSTDNTSR